MKVYVCQEFVSFEGEGGEMRCYATETDAIRWVNELTGQSDQYWREYREIELEGYDVASKTARSLCS